MPDFNYIIRSEGGSRKTGSISAKNYNEAMDKLQAENSVVVKLTERDTSFDFFKPFLEADFGCQFNLCHYRIMSNCESLQKILKHQTGGAPSQVHPPTHPRQRLGRCGTHNIASKEKLFLLENRVHVIDFQLHQRNKKPPVPVETPGVSFTNRCV